MKVEHQPSRQRFVASLAGGEGELTYRQLNAQVLDLVHTSVEPALRGRGMGGALVRSAMEYARGAGLKIVPTCSYVEHWLESHPEYQDLVTTRPG
ncbi:MAG: N-acetyltransferase [Gammaproteobacteria bacterium]|nr:N-acetyltransferase [Gammaproteobacteria bacterium]